MFRTYVRDCLLLKTEHQLIVVQSVTGTVCFNIKSNTQHVFYGNKITSLHYQMYKQINKS